MLVKTVDNNELQKLCKCLAYKVYESTYHPDCVLAVPTGGIIPAEIIRNELCQLYNDNSIELVDIGCNQKKNITFNRLLRLLPTTLLNYLRVISLKIKRVVPSPEIKHIRIDIPAKCKNILIVDDAIDTGKTLSEILEGLNDNINYKIAVLTVTLYNPKVVSDYNIFNNVILRLPWAIDVK